MTETIIAVDLGGTRVRAALLNNRMEILKREETLTDDERGLEATLETIKQLIYSVLPADRNGLLGIGICAPGPLNPITGVVVSPPNLKGWHNVPLGDILKAEFDLPVYVGNDANVAGLAEAILGAANGYRHVIYITVSTGIGSGIITDGRMLLGVEGLGAEAGHIVMMVDGRVSTLEKESAGPALARKAVARMEAGEQTIMRDLVGGDMRQVSGSTVGEAAVKGDALALEIVRQGGRVLGMGMTSLLHLFNPEILVFGGGVSKLGDLLFDPMREAIRETTIDTAYWRNLKIVRAGLGENVGLIGAACLVPTRGGVEDIRDVRASLWTEEHN
jgi:glucokinase